MRLLIIALLLGCSSAAPRGETVPREEPRPVTEADAAEEAPASGATSTRPSDPVDMSEQHGTMRPRPEPEHPTEPEPVPPQHGQARLVAGSPCLSARDCASGICEGVGCSEAAPGTCAPAERACTRDRRAYCGCDGKTFYASGSCPGRRFAKRGSCGDPVP